MKVFRFLGLLFIVLSFATLAQAKDSFTVCGTGDSEILLTELANAFMAEHSEVNINVPPSVGSSGGIRKVADGKCELGRVARKIKNKEKKYNLSYKLLAYSPIVFVTNKNVTIDTLSTRQIIGIFSGKFQNWESLGGSNSPIYVAKREKGDSSRSVIEKNILPLQKIDLWAGKATYTTSETLQTVAKYQNTISFSPLAMAKNFDVQVLQYNGISATSENVKSGKYPLSVPLGLVWKGELNGAVKTFFDFIFSQKAQTIISKNGSIAASL